MLQLKAYNNENWEASLHVDHLHKVNPARQQTHYVSSTECVDETRLNVTREEAACSSEQCEEDYMTMSSRYAVTSTTPSASSKVKTQAS